ncbi:MAG TPA: hypothetical protein PKE16_07295, partial [Hyphomicrobium sp.]|nr:hypothetical protein [Hyphomicrobium sp.]
ASHKWTQQQLVYISQLHLTTLMLMTGRIRLVEQQGDKQVVVDESKKEPPQTCSAEQKEKVKEMIDAYVAASPPPNFAQAGQKPPAAAGAPVSTGSTSVSETTVQKK